MAFEKKSVSLKEVKNLLQEGYVRYKNQVTDAYLGSVEEKLELDASECKQIFDHPKLKGIRVALPSRIELVDDLDELDIVDDIDSTVMEEETSSVNVFG